MLPIKQQRHSNSIIAIIFMLLLFMMPMTSWSAEPTNPQGGQMSTDDAQSGVPPTLNTKPSAESVTAQTMLKNIAADIPQLTSLVTAFAFVFGIFLIVSGVMNLKHIGEMRTMSSHEHHLIKPIALLVVGSLLLYLPSAVQVGLQTFWTNPNPYGYPAGDDASQWSEIIHDCFLVVQFIGVIAFIRGLIIFSHTGGGGHQQGGFAKGITFVIAGIFCINIYGFVKVIVATLGLPDPF